MIRNNDKVGERLFHTVEFGTGDVGILGPAKTEDKRVDIILWQHVEKPEEEWAVKMEERNSDDLPDGSIVLSFNKIASVDQLIKALNEAKNKLAEDLIIPNTFRHA